jgi:RHS repeat-associated protein
VYDGLDHNVQIVETRSGTVTGTKQFVWCGDERCEARDATGSVIAQYFAYGQTIDSNKYCYTEDRLGSIIEMTDSSDNVQASYKYDPWGRLTKLQGSLDSEFQYAGYYYHSASGLSLSLYRAYTPAGGRWIARDPIEEAGGENMYAYSGNDPIDFTDSLGLTCLSCSAVPPGRPGRPGPPKPPPDRRQGYCLSEGCCWDERRGCFYECYRKAINENKSPCWLRGCLNCCNETYAYCNEIVSGGRRFYVYKFDDCWSD